MKKLLSALFILGSVATLAQETLDRPGGGGGHDGDNGQENCYTSACSVERKMDIKVSIPTQLKITKLGDIDLGKWCGTKTISEDAPYALEGEKDARVKVYFENIEVPFYRDGTRHGEGNGAGFAAYMSVDGKSESHVKLEGKHNPKGGHNPNGGLGSATGKVKATLYPVAQGVQLVAGGKYKATAKLIAEYDSF